jgi:hypothetical protein
MLMPYQLNYRFPHAYFIVASLGWLLGVAPIASAQLSAMPAAELSPYTVPNVGEPRSGAYAPGMAGDGGWALGAEQGLREPAPDMATTPLPASPLAATAETIAPFSSLRGPVALPVGGSTYWNWWLLPEEIIYKSYLAGVREPRFGAQLVYLRDYGWVWDATLGARVGLLRYGTKNQQWPEGWQIDAEGAAFPRLDAERSRDLLSSDFRFGFPLTFRRGPWEAKFGYYHLSAHLGDEYVLANWPQAQRLNYVRDTLVFGVGLRPHPDWRLYFETGYAVYVDGGAKPWELMFGAEFSPAEPTTLWGAPFAAAHGHLRQDNDFSGNVTMQLGWQWRGQHGRLMRIGAHYFNGLSEQYQFYRRFEDQIGIGIWYDF